jgi:transcriptional regulator with XRE-family HTH domain
MEVKMKNLASLLAEKLKDKDFEKQYHRNETFFRLADELLLLRKKRGITQKELAEKMGTTQAVISRLENATVKPSMETIIKVAEALGAVVDTRLIPLEEIKKEVEEDEQVVSQKQQDALQGIIYFHAEKSEEGTANWIDAEKFSSILSISGKPSLAPISATKKVRELA